MKKVLLFCLAAVMTLSLVLTGCTGTEDNGTNVQGSNDSEKEKATLSLWAYDPSTDKRGVLEGIISDFEEQTGHTVNITYIPKDDFNTKLSASIAVDEAPDISYLDQPKVVEFAVDDIILDLEEYANGDNGIDKSKYYQGALKTNVVNGQLHGLPMNQTCVALYYNKALVPNPPETWEEYIEMAKSIYKEGEVAAFELPGGGWGGWLFPAFVGSAGGQMVTDDETKVAFDQQPAIDALDLWVELKKYSDQEVYQSADAFQNDLVATKVSGPWELPNYRENYPDLDFGVALIPSKGENNPHASNIGGENLVVYKSTKYPQAAWDFIKFSTYSAENALAISEVTGNFPVLLEAAKDEKFQNDEELKVFLEQMETAQARPRIKEWLKINDEIIATAIDQAITGELSAKEALEQGAEKANSLIGQ